AALISSGSDAAANYSITYNSGVVSGMPADISDVSVAEDVTLPSTQPTRSGYTFNGWCTIAGSDTCTGGTIYTAGSTWALNQTSPTNTLTLYAMWAVAAPGSCTDASTCMQTMTIANCPTTTTTVTDARDGKSYTVAKLADGKCWMTSNLNIAGGTQLSSDDTDFDSTYTLPTTNGWTVSDGKLVLPDSSTGFSADNYAYVNNSNSTTCGKNSPCYSYYSWDAATLGSGRSISTNTDAAYSICPKGWRLPTSRTTSATNWQTTSDFYALAHQYGLDSTTSTSESDNGFYTQAGPGTTPNFLLAGYYFGGSFYDGGSYGGYWSATSGSNNTYARNLNFDSSNVYSAGNGYRRNGFGVRCILSGQ
ncbi:InlB B-repeat-containing protein, partial [Candidatus Saccharibacteria bacterium]|nr:InlB B-repeat-containing protein [Candidatus Saccharibacteria bacterium]